jgi:hypothetical protein
MYELHNDVCSGEPPQFSRQNPQGGGSIAHNRSEHVYHRI